MLFAELVAEFCSRWNANHIDTSQQKPMPIDLNPSIPSQKPGSDEQLAIPGPDSALGKIISGTEVSDRDIPDGDSSPDGVILTSIPQSACVESLTDPSLLQETQAAIPPPGQSPGELICREELIYYGNNAQQNDVFDSGVDWYGHDQTNDRFWIDY
jgi:hypothetical protein